MISPRLVVTASLLAAAALTACSGGRQHVNSSPGSRPDGAQTSASTAPHSSAAATLNPSTSSVSPTSTGQPSAGPSSHTTGPALGTLAPPATPLTQLRPAAAGTYRYTVSGTSSTGPVPGSAVLTVSTVSGDEQTFSLADTDSAGNGTTEAETVAYRVDGIYLVSLHIATEKPAPYAQTLVPVGGPVRVIDANLAGGARTFRVASADASATITFSVLGRTTAVVGGMSLPALHISLSSSDLSGTVDGVAYRHGMLSVDALLSTSSPLAYRQHSQSAITVGLFRFSFDTAATLTSVQRS